MIWIIYLKIKFVAGHTKNNLVSNEGFSISSFKISNINDGLLTNMQLIKSILILPLFAVSQGIIFYIGKYMIEWSGSTN